MSGLPDNPRPDEPADAAKPDATEAFLSLLLQNQRRVHAYILSLVPNRNDADDLLQETIVVLWRKFDQYEPGTDFVGWAVAVARFEVLRFQQKHARSKLIFSEGLLESLSEVCIARSAELEDRHDALEHCLGKLTDRDRDLIRLRYREGLTIKQVAGRVSRPVAGMYKAMARIHTGLTRCVHQVMAGGER